MTHSTARLILASPLAAFALACGSGPPPPAPPSPVPPPLAVDPVMASPTGGLAAIAAVKRPLKVAADPDAAPFLSKTGAAYEGFEYALAEAIAQGAGLTVQIVPATFSELPDAVTSGRADLAIGQLSPSASYDGLAWSVSYLQYSLCLIAPASSPIKAMPDLKGKKVGMYDDPVARQLTSVLVGATYEPVIFEDYGYFEKMVRGQLDAMVYDCPLARYELKMYGDKLKIVDDALNITTYNAAVRKDDPKLLSDVNAALKSLGEQGLLATLEQRWLGESAKTGSYQTAAGRVVVVGRGESLSMIAGRELGSVERWKALYEANRDVVGPDPDLVYAGMRLRVPK
jgi:ABC-type amino acid transport substrate-binding protein